MGWPDMDVGVFGSRGYLGSRIVEALTGESRGRVIPLDREALPDADVVIDAGFPRDYQKGTFGPYRRLLEARCEWCAASGAHFVYLGSYSSSPNAKSLYGRLKYEAESIVEEYGGTVLPVPLVVCRTSPGGRYGELARIVNRLPVVPVPDPSEFRVPIVEEHDFLLALAAVLESEATALRLMRERTQVSSLGQLVTGIPASRKRLLLRMGPNATRLAATIAQHLRIGPLDNLSSIA